MPRYITTPKPFTRDICGPGNRVTLGRKVEVNGIHTFTLSGSMLNQWDSPLTSELFRRAVKSIARERNKESGHPVRVQAAGGRVLFEAPVIACADCGSTKDVSFEADPYNSEIHADNEEVLICESCAERSSQEI